MDGPVQPGFYAGSTPVQGRSVTGIGPALHRHCTGIAPALPRMIPPGIGFLQVQCHTFDPVA